LRQLLHYYEFMRGIRRLAMMPAMGCVLHSSLKRSVNWPRALNQDQIARAELISSIINLSMQAFS
jgi:hypothetical protein